MKPASGEARKRTAVRELLGLAEDARPGLRVVSGAAACSFSCWVTIGVFT
jgi:hypothetical protein